jgi:hypothetical protein
VYLTVDNHRNDDLTNYLYRSADFGQTWTSIAGDLPPARVARTIREDAVNPSLLYLGTEFGVFVTIDGGRHWVSFQNNLPTVAVNDLLVHPHENDLVLGTHGRGVWILDSVSALQGLTPAVVTSASKLFAPKPAAQIRYANLIPQTGDVFYRGQNPPTGGIIDYWLGTTASGVVLSIHAPGGAEVTRVATTNHRGINRVIWNLRAADLLPPGASPTPAGGVGAAGRGGRGRGGAGGLPGALVPPDTYTVRLTVDGKSEDQPIVVSDDPRIDASAAERTAWRNAQASTGDLWKRVAAVNAAFGGVTAGSISDANRKMATELQTRLSVLYTEIDNWTGQPTSDQLSQLAYYRTMVERLERLAR